MARLRAPAPEPEPIEPERHDWRDFHDPAERLPEHWVPASTAREETENQAMYRLLRAQRRAQRADAAAAALPRRRA